MNKGKWLDYLTKGVISKVKNKRHLVAIASAVSFLSLLYEVTLTKIFSLLLGAQLGFFALSFAVLGGGLGAAYLARQRSTPSIREKIWKGWVISYLLSAVAMLPPWPFNTGMVVYLLAASLPFFWTGALMSDLFSSASRQTHQLYFADLTGAALGSLASILILNRFGGIGATAVVIVVASAISFLVGGSSRSLKLVAVFVAAGALAIPVLSLRLQMGANTPKPLFDLLKQQSSIIWSRWDALGRTDVVADREDTKRYIFIDGSAGTAMVGHPERPEVQAAIKQDIAYVPYAVRTPANTLIIGPGGGKDVLMALLAGSTKTTAVELNASTVDAVRQMSDYNGSIYNNPNVNVVVADGRSYVQQSRDQYDLIYLSLVMTGTAERNGLALTESYVYTEEAFSQYLSHLTPNGYLALVLHDDYDLTKAVSTSLAALHTTMPVSEAAQRLVIVGGKPGAEHADMNMSRPVLLVASKAWSRDDVNRIAALASSRGASLLYAPGVAESGPLLGVAQGSASLEAFAGQFDFDARPATDDRPYFYKMDKGVPTFILAVMLLSLLLLLQLSNRMVSKSPHKARAMSQGLIFAALGAAFMMVETAIVGQFTLFIGRPVLVLPVLLTMLLVGAGLGSHVAGRQQFIVRHMALVGIAITGYLWRIPAAVEWLQLIGGNWSLAERLVAVGISVTPLGFLMGIPFPTLLRKAGEFDPDLVPWLWATNGIGSVIGTAGYLAVSMITGNRIGLWLGAFLYLVTVLAAALSTQRLPVQAQGVSDDHGVIIGSSADREAAATLSVTQQMKGDNI